MSTTAKRIRHCFTGNYITIKDLNDATPASGLDFRLDGIHKSWCEQVCDKVPSSSFVESGGYLHCHINRTDMVVFIRELQGWSKSLAAYILDMLGFSCVECEFPPGETTNFTDAYAMAGFRYYCGSPVRTGDLVLARYDAARSPLVGGGLYRIEKFIASAPSGLTVMGAVYPAKVFTLEERG